MEEAKEKIEYIPKERRELAIGAMNELQNILYTEDFEKVEKQVWKVLHLMEDETFHTAED